MLPVSYGDWKFENSNNLTLQDYLYTAVHVFLYDVCILVIYIHPRESGGGIPFFLEYYLAKIDRKFEINLKFEIALLFQLRCIRQVIVEAASSRSMSRISQCE